MISIKRSIIVIAVSLMAAAGSWAARIQVSPGSLAADPDAVAAIADGELILEGAASAADLATLRSLSGEVTSVDISSLTLPSNQIPANMLFGTNVRTVKLNPATTSIGDHAFAATMIEEMVLPAAIEKVGDYAFSGCPVLTNFTFASSPELGKAIFSGDEALTSVTFGANTSQIPDKTFEGCTSLDMALPESIETIGATAFRRSGLRMVDLRHIKSIGDFAFAEMPRLTGIIYAVENSPKLGKGVFFANPVLTAIPALPADIPALVMAHTGAGGTITVYAREVGEAAYANNPQITQVNLMPGVTNIKAHAFRNDTGISNVNVSKLEENVPEIDTDAFSGLENADGNYDIALRVLKGTENAWKQHPVWSRFNLDIVSYIDSAITENASLRAWRDGDAIIVKANAPMELVEVFSISGARLYERRNAGESIAIPGVAADEIAMVRAVVGTTVSVVKLM